MRVIFVTQVILLMCGVSRCHIGQDCSSDAEGNCLSFESCENGKCVLCTKQNAICGGLSNWRCCEGTTCESIPGLLDNAETNGRMCVPNNNNCRIDADCSGGLRCIARLGKCGLCHSNGEKCTLPYDKYECCSSYCAINLNNTVCADPSLVGLITDWSKTSRDINSPFGRVDTPTTTTTPKPARYDFNNNPYAYGSSRQNCHKITGTVCPQGEKCSLGGSFPYFFHCTKCVNTRETCPPGPPGSFTDCCAGHSCKLDGNSPTFYSCQSDQQLFFG